MIEKGADLYCVFRLRCRVEPADTGDDEMSHIGRETADIAETSDTPAVIVSEHCFREIFYDF